jgi:hypothetical protein
MKNKTNTPIVSNKTLLKSYAASIELLERENEQLKRRLEEALSIEMDGDGMINLEIERRGPIVAQAIREAAEKEDGKR